MLPSEAPREFRLGWLFVREQASALAVAGQGWIWGSWGRLRSLENEDLKQQKAPKAHGPNQLQQSFTPLAIPAHGHQSHKVCEEQEELTLLYQQKSEGSMEISAGKLTALTINLTILTK